MTDDELNERIRAICEERGIFFKPWEMYRRCRRRRLPASPRDRGRKKSWPEAQQLRRQLVAEIEAEIEAAAATAPLDAFLAKRREGGD